MEKLNEIGEKLKVGGADLSRRMSIGVSTMSEKMKELFQASTPADRLVEDATAETLDGTDWQKTLEICDMVNTEQMSGQDVVRALKKRLLLGNPTVQFLSLCLLESCIKNCEKMFSEVASEKVLDEMVRTVDDPTTDPAVREKALKLIESWGESTEELRYLPVYEQTYKSLKSRGIRFPGRDVESLAPIFTPAQTVPTTTTSSGMDYREALVGGQQSFDPMTPPNAPVHAEETLGFARNCVELLSTVLTSSPPQEVLKDDLTTTLVEQCRQSQAAVQRIVERAGDDETRLFEALDVHGELEKVLSKYGEMAKLAESGEPIHLEPALIPVGVIEEELAFACGEDTALIRTRSAKPPPSSQSVKDDDDTAAIADLDEMIFGRKGDSSSPPAPTEKKDDDLITL